MSLRHIPLPLAHFEVGLRLPMDPTFVDFLVFARVQPGQIHPNAIRNLFSLICLCRRLGFELSMNILRMFFSSLRMSDNTLSLHLRRNRVKLFDSPPNKIDFKGKWVMVESKVGFPFRPSVNEDYQWSQILYLSSLDPSEKAFLEAITRDLGDSRQTQTRVYSSTDLLSEESLKWCGIGAGLDSRREELGFEVEAPNHDWTIHPRGVFSIHCEHCISTVRGCRTGRGKLSLSIMLSFFFLFCSIF